MDRHWEDLISYYRRQGAPGNQQALIALLRELQQESGGSLSSVQLQQTAEAFSLQESFLRAIIRRIPSLHLAEGHTLELCAGKNCSRSRALAEYAEVLSKKHGFTLRYVPCMRLCGKGPNFRWDGKVYHKGDEALLRQLTGENRHKE
ncbi:MAG: NAD(P)H-dependent oxidoreductase subunit E [Oscillospiraceae bacterium]|nr:NAD(P)H-dependent oxidoreductase subunit E [Oscillospiraceae bacterium]